MSTEQTYTPMTKEALYAIKKGDAVERMLGFSIPCYIIIKEVTEERIISAWEFDRETGLEIDEDLQDMSVPLKDRMQISYLRRVLTEEQKQLLTDGAREVPYE